MEKIDIKDKKILFHLLQDSRQPLSKIAKKVGISKELISYRIKRMQEKEIIQNFTTIIDDTKLGFFGLTYYYSFDHINPSIRAEMIKLLVDSKYTRYVASTDGKYDMVVWYNIANQNIFINFYEEMLRNYRKYLSNQILTGDIGVELFSYDFLISDTQRQITKIKTKKSNFKWFVVEKIDDIDISLLKELSTNPRIKIIDLAKKLKSTSNIITYRIKKLIDNGIIFGFSATINWLKIGLRYFTLEIYLNDYNQKNKILNYIKANPCLIKIFKSVGHGVDIKCDIILHDVEHLRKTIEDITNMFPNSIKNIDYFNTYKINKLNYLPPI
jgi:DNA-binding Lrp family transcriptional regulator